MENLVGRKVECIRGSANTTKGKIYLIKNVIERNFCIIEDDNEKRLWDISHIGVFFKLTLDEWQPKQGDKVLYTDDLEFWHEGILLTKHNDSYIIESDEMLLYAIEIKPYEEEIKVGDWVVSELNDCVFKYQFGRVKGDLTKITDEVLINKLNEL